MLVRLLIVLSEVLAALLAWKRMKTPYGLNFHDGVEEASRHLVSCVFSEHVGIKRRLQRECGQQRLNQLNTE